MPVIFESVCWSRESSTLTIECYGALADKDEFRRAFDEPLTLQYESV